MTSAAFCTQCGQQNSGNMAFCINCGASMFPVPGGGTGEAARGGANLTGAGSFPGSYPAGSAAASAAGSAGQRACASCGQTDPLNGVFCIFCGASVDGTDGNGAISDANAGGLSRSTPPGGIGAVPGSVAGAPDVKKSFLPGTIGPLILTGILGAAFGVGLALFTAQGTGGSDKPVLALPEQGLTILTAQPDSYFKISSMSNKRFIAGKTGAEGDVSIEELRPDKYHVSIIAPDGKRHEEDFELTRDNPVVIGGQNGSQLFE